MKAAGGEGGIRTPGTGFSPVQQISNLPCSATPAPLRGGGSPVRERLFGGTGLVRLAQGLALVSAMAGAGCGPGPKAPATARGGTERPSILLVTLDTTRADAIGPEAEGIETPAFTALAARGLRFRQAYATVPETLPSHASIFTGLLPAGHGVHENARVLARDRTAGRGATPEGGLSHGRLRFELRARAPLRPGARLRGLRRRAAGRAGRAERRRDDRARAFVPRARRAATAAALGPLLRPAPSLQPARALPDPVREGPLPRRGRGDGRGARTAARRLRAARGGAGGDPGGGRPRRGARRARRVAARPAALPGDDARSAAARRARASAPA